MWRYIKAARVLLPAGLTWRTMVGWGVVAGLLALAFCFGRWGAVSGAANDPHDSITLPIQVTSANVPKDPRAPVAYIYNSIPITRQELGEFLIARVGAERLEFLVMRKIIEQECLKRGMGVTDAEVEAQLVDDLRAMNIPSLKAFVDGILTRYKKTLFEYKEDVVRLKLELRKLCSVGIKVLPNEVQEAFEAKYGPKVHCRVIGLAKEMRMADRQKVWNAVRNDEKAFLEYARKNNTPSLASTGGLVPPIHQHFGDKVIERIAFSLDKGEVSEVFQIADKSWIILRCEERIPSTTGQHQMADEYRTLEREVFERKLAEAVPEAYESFRKAANPTLLEKKETLDPVMVHSIDRQLHLTALDRAKLLNNQHMPPGVKGN
jgi:hypothetical protein